MGLFDKYFGSGDTKNDESHSSNSEIIKEYEKKTIFCCHIYVSPANGFHGSACYG